MSVGRRLGPYEITAKLGEGGMGEVYQAKDFHLGRNVALKVLPEGFTQDAERLARFEREAKLLAQLNHPNIAQIYGLEVSGDTRALVMELVDGPTLADRLEHGPLPFDESLSVALQIARALEEAHEKGIVHRDLKPQNIKASIEGKVKVLDFGLAKAMDPASTASGGASASQLAQSPTLTMGATMQGVILGTAAYMSPEQAKGLVVDKRADVWAFGVVLWEMLSGRRLFAGESVTETLASVLRNEIDFDALPPETPAGIRGLLRRCLERDPKIRLRDIGEARIALQRALDPASASDQVAVLAPAAPPRSRIASLLPWLVAAGLAIALVASWMVRARGGAAPNERSPILALHLPTGLSIPLDDRGIYGQTAVLAISPDGARVAFLEGAGSGPIYLREIESDELRPLEGTNGASSPFFSPDGRWIGFFSPGKLRKIAIDGGRPIDLVDATLDRGAVWCPDGSIVFAPNATGGLLRLPAGGGTPVPLTEVDAKAGERTHRWPALLPDGREVAFTIGVVGRPGDYEESRIDAVELATGKRRTLLTGASMVRFTATGLVLLGRQGQVLATPLDGLGPESVEAAKQVIRNVGGVPASGVVHFDVARDGTLIYAERDPHSDELDLVWLARSGEIEPLSVPKAEYRILRISPDGRRVAMAIGPGGGRGGDIWILDLATASSSKLTFEGRSWTPIWTRDGQEVVFTVSFPSGEEEFLQRPADGSREARVLVHFADARARAPIGWLADGSLLYWEDGGTGHAGDLFYLAPGAKGDQAKPFAASPAIEIQPSISPDGRYVAYSADTVGSAEIHVQPFPPTGAKWQVANGGSLPTWSRDGSRLDFTSEGRLYSVPVSLSGTFSIGAPREVTRIPDNLVPSFDTSTALDLAADGRFLVVRSSSKRVTNDHLVVVLNWTEKLRRGGLGAPR